MIRNAMSAKNVFQPSDVQEQFCFDPLPVPTLVPAAQAVSGQAAGSVTALPPNQVGALAASTPDEAPLDPADFAALREVLARYGSFQPAPLDPPWADPRSDLVGDHGSFPLLLETAYRLDGQDLNGVFGALVGIRCCGARLTHAGPANWSRAPEGPRPTWRLVRGDEMTEAEYAGYRQTYLAPHTAALTRLLSAPPAAQPV